MESLDLLPVNFFVLEFQHILIHVVLLLFWGSNGLKEFYFFGYFWDQVVERVLDCLWDWWRLWCFWFLFFLFFTFLIIFFPLFFLIIFIIFTFWLFSIFPIDLLFFFLAVFVEFFFIVLFGFFSFLSFLDLLSFFLFLRGFLGLLSLFSEYRLLLLLLGLFLIWTFIILPCFLLNKCKMELVNLVNPQEEWIDAWTITYHLVGDILVDLVKSWIFCWVIFRTILLSRWCILFRGVFLFVFLLRRLFRLLNLFPSFSKLWAFRLNKMSLPITYLFLAPFI